VPSFGERLKQEREQRGISLEEISHSTKISTRLLHALEEDHFNQLPGGIFNKGFIRAYARHLGMDEEQAVADYIAATTPVVLEKKSGSVVPAAAEVWPEPETDGAAGLPWGMFAVVLLVAALGFAAWGVYSREKRASAPPPVAPQAEASPAHSTTEPPAVILPASNAQPIPVRSISPATVPLNLRIRLEEDSWLAITADGKEVSRGMFTGSSEKNVQASRTIQVKAGNIGGIDFEFNGKRLPPQGDYDEVKTLIFDANGVRAALKPEAPAAQPEAPVPQP